MKKSVIFSLLCVLAQGCLVDACIHDSLNHKLASGEQSYGANHPFVVAEQRRRRQRRLQDLGGDLAAQPQAATQEYDRLVGQEVDPMAYAPIRITPYYDNASIYALPKEKQDVLFKIVPDAIKRFQALLSVVPVQGNLMASRSCDIQWVTTPIVCKTFVQNEECLEMPIPQSHFAPSRSCYTCISTGCGTGSSCKTIDGVGVPNSDFVMYVRAASTSYCTSSVLAYAASCQKDQYDRPTFGMVNFCPSQLSDDPYKYTSQLSTALHEITHALGFSAQFFPYMRNEDGTPRTPRDKNGQPASYKQFSCPNGNTASYYTAPSTTTVAFSSERDTSVARLVTPRVAAFVRSHFGCDKLTGAEIENQDDGCLGSHWEERIFEPEYMTPISSFRNVLSGLTLAFFEDSGWYKTNQSMAERLHFGAKRGCPFALDKCINKSTGKATATDHYCTSNSVEGCTVDATSRSVCTLTTLDSAIPPAYQYFTDSKRGGNNEYADYCPINTGFRGGDCTVPDNLVRPTASSTINILGETYCPTCKCTTTSLRSSDSTAWVVNSRRQTGCYAMRCAGNTTVEISVPVVGSKTGAVHKVNCSMRGEELKIDGYSGVITCPDPSVLCDNAQPNGSVVSTNTQKSMRSDAQHAKHVALSVVALLAAVVWCM